MQIVIDIPITEEEFQKDAEETLERFRRAGLIPIEESDVKSQESDE